MSIDNNMFINIINMLNNGVDVLFQTYIHHYYIDLFMCYIKKNCEVLLFNHNSVINFRFIYLIKNNKNIKLIFKNDYVICQHCIMYYYNKKKKKLKYNINTIKKQYYIIKKYND